MNMENNYFILEGNKLYFDVVYKFDKATLEEKEMTTTNLYRNLEEMEGDKIEVRFLKIQHEKYEIGKHVNMVVSFIDVVVFKEKHKVYKNTLDEIYNESQRFLVYLCQKGLFTDEFMFKDEGDVK